MWRPKSSNKKKIDGVRLEITDAVNAVGSCSRTVAQVKEKWRNMMKKASADYKAERISLSKTGGGPAPPKMSQTSKDLVDLLKGSASFSGIPGAEECESLFHNSDLEQKQIEEEVDMDILWEVDENVNEINTDGITYTVPPGSIIKSQPASSIEETPHRQTTSADKSTTIQSSKPKTLKDLQMEYYSQAIAVHNVQMECLQKCQN